MHHVKLSKLHGRIDERVMLDATAVCVELFLKRLCFWCVGSASRDGCSSSGVENLRRGWLQLGWAMNKGKKEKNRCGSCGGWVLVLARLKRWR